MRQCFWYNKKDKERVHHNILSMEILILFFILTGIIYSWLWYYLIFVGDKFILVIVEIKDVYWLRKFVFPISVVT